MSCGRMNSVKIRPISSSGRNPKTAVTEGETERNFPRDVEIEKKKAGEEEEKEAEEEEGNADGVWGGDSVQFGEEKNESVGVGIGE